MTLRQRILKSWITTKDNNIKIGNTEQGFALVECLCVSHIAALTLEHQHGGIRMWGLREGRQSREWRLPRWN